MTGLDILANNPLEFFGLLAVLAGTGVVAGLLAGLLGVGGGIVVVPVLYNLFGLVDVDPILRMHLAVGTSLATIIPTSLASTFAHYKNKSVDWQFLKGWLAPVFLGALIGTAVAGRIDGYSLSGIFALLATLVAIYMMFETKLWVLKLPKPRPTSTIKALIGSLIGTTSAMMGIGGGTFAVPILKLFSFPIHRAVGTAAALGAVIGIPGTMGMIWAGLAIDKLPPFSFGYVNLLGFVVISPIAALVAPVGARLAHILRKQYLQALFAIFLILTALRMFVQIAI